MSKYRRWLLLLTLVVAVVFSVYVIRRQLERTVIAASMDDMAITFHVISDFKGQVLHQDMIARRLLQLDNVNFPAGILFDGHYENHLNWDAVKIFRSAWPTLDEASRRQVREEISRMLDWCLTKSYQPDGSFKVSDLDDTQGDACTEFGFCRRPVTSSAETDFGPARISLVPKLFRSA